MSAADVHAVGDRRACSNWGALHVPARLPSNPTPFSHTAHASAAPPLKRWLRDWSSSMLAAPLRLSTGMIALSRPPAAAPARGWALSARVARPLAPLRPRALSNGSSSDSFDAEDGMDYRLARELDAVADPAKYKRLAGRLDLLYAATGTQAEVRGDR